MLGFLAGGGEGVPFSVLVVFSGWPPWGHLTKLGLGVGFFWPFRMSGGICPAICFW